MVLAPRIPGFLVSFGIVCFALLHLAAVGPFWEITPDSTVYMEGARAIVEGRPYEIPLRPPATSLAFAVALAAVPEGYLLLNLLTTLSALLAMIPVFLLMRRLLGVHAAGPIVLLSLGSTLVFRHGTLLLSESLFLLFSMAALYAVERGRDSDWSIQGLIGATLGVFVASMTRIVAFVAACAVVAEETFNSVRDTRSLKNVRWMPILAMGLVISADAAWELRNTFYGYSTVDLAVQAQPWTPSEGYLTLRSLLDRFSANVLDFRMIGHVLANGDPSHAETHPLFRVMAASAFGLFAVGLVRRLRRPTHLEFYLLFSFALFSVYYIQMAIRWFGPLVPLLWFYAWSGGEYVWSLLSERSRTVRVAAALPAVAGLAAYCVFGVQYMLAARAEAQSSPFPESAIKYSANYDLQRSAVWASRHSSEDEVMLTQHSEVVQLIAKRKTLSFPLTSDWSAWSAVLDSAGVRYVLADELEPMVQRYLLPLAEEHPERFQFVSDFGDARIYEVRPAAQRGDGR